MTDDGLKIMLRTERSGGYLQKLVIVKFDAFSLILPISKGY